MEAACFWIEKYHIDGWRLDVSIEGGEEKDILLYKKCGQNEVLYVLLHKNSGKSVYSLPKELRGIKCKDCMSGETVTMGNELNLKAYDYRMYIPVR